MQNYAVSVLGFMFRMAAGLMLEVSNLTLLLPFGKAPISFYGSNEACG